MKKIWLLALALLSFTACSEKSVYSGFHEIDEISLIQTIGVDEEDGEVVLTLASGSPMEEKPVTVIKNRAKTISRALEEAQKSNATEKYLSFAHVRHFLVGAKAAENLHRYLDYPERLMSMRLDVNVYIAREGTAEAMITAAIGDEIGISQLLDSFAESIDLLSEVRVFTLGEIANSLAKNGDALVSAVSFAKKEEVISGRTEQVVTAAGYAVIEDGKMREFLSPEAAKGANILGNRFKADLVELDDGTGGFAGVYLTSAACRYEPIFQNGRLESVRIKLKITGNVQELQNPIDIYDGAVREDLEGQISDLAKRRVLDAIEKSQELACDFMDLGWQVERRAAHRFAKMQENWESIFPHLPFHVEVETRLERTYDIGRPLEYDGKNSQ